ncbi:hypothetical protein OEZ85_002617 [Tetradesmus obliquus]|uniref:Uncharacterized protein n=1 Tax=Tetradesmus obliquus TaxID=3088 RepID=A0ABY8TY44_TETOB|nr:hypothetical protein OEZ85_002617 [Tetradesmus obliquus]
MKKRQMLQQYVQDVPALYTKQQLRQQLQRAIDSPAAAAAAAAAASAAAAVKKQQPQQTDTGMRTAGVPKFQGVGGLGLSLPASSNAALGLTQLTPLNGSSSSSSSSHTSLSSSASRMAAGMAAAVLRCSGNVPGCFAVQRLCSSSVSCVQQELEALADAVERSLMQGRAVITAFGWSQMMALDNEQMSAMIVTGFPYLPLIRGVVGHLLGKEELQQQQQQSV